MFEVGVRGEVARSIVAIQLELIERQGALGAPPALVVFVLGLAAQRVGLHGAAADFVVRVLCDQVQPAGILRDADEPPDGVVTIL